VKLCISRFSRPLQLAHEFQRLVVLSQAFLSREREIRVDQIQVEARVTRSLERIVGRIHECRLRTPPVGAKYFLALAATPLVIGTPIPPHVVHVEGSTRKAKTEIGNRYSSASRGYSLFVIRYSFSAA
jgi:hypothetical protein